MNNRTGLGHCNHQQQQHQHQQHGGRRSVTTTSTTTTTLDEGLVSGYRGRDLIQASIMASFTRKLPQIRPSSSTTSMDRVSTMRHRSNDGLDGDSMAPLVETTPVPLPAAEGTYVIRSHIIPATIPTNIYQRHKILYQNHYPHSTTLQFPRHFQNTAVHPPTKVLQDDDDDDDDDDDERFLNRSKRSHDEINSHDSTASDRTSFDEPNTSLSVIQENSCMTIPTVPPMLSRVRVPLPNASPTSSPPPPPSSDPHSFDKTGIIGAYNIRRGATTIEKILNDPCIQANKVAYDRVLTLVESMRLDADAMEETVPLDTRFERGLKALLDFKTKHGHFRLPAKHTRHKYLSKWMRDVRRAYWEKMNVSKSGYDSEMDRRNLHLLNTSGREMSGFTELEKNELATKIQFRTMLTQQHIQFLAKMGFVWEPTKIILTPKTWEERFDELKRFKKEKGHCNVPQKYANNPSLGNWVHSQRKEFEKRRTTGVATITDEQIAKLNSIEFVWKLRFGRPKKKSGDNNNNNNNNTSLNDQHHNNNDDNNNNVVVVLPPRKSVVTTADRIPSSTCFNNLKTTTTADDCRNVVCDGRKTTEGLYRPRKKSQKTNGKSSHQHHDKVPTAA